MDIETNEKRKHIPFPKIKKEEVTLSGIVANKQLEAVWEINDLENNTKKA